MIEEGVISLDDHPQQYLDWWTDDQADPRSQITLAQFLSFTSGFSGGTGLVGDEVIPCVEDGEVTLDDCAQTIYAEYFTFELGRSFFYGPAHMHLAATMVVVATGEDWNRLLQRLIR